MKFPPKVQKALEFFDPTWEGDRSEHDRHGEALREFILQSDKREINIFDEAFSKRILP